MRSPYPPVIKMYYVNPDLEKVVNGPQAENSELYNVLKRM